MSKKKHRDKRKSDNENMMGMNPQIMEMLRGSNIDINKVSALMGAMNQDGFDINSLAKILGGANLPNMNNSQLDLNSISAMLKNMDLNNNNFANNNMNYGTNQSANNNYVNANYKVQDIDENIEMLLTVKSVVNPKKAKFLEKVIEMYKNGEINY